MDIQGQATVKAKKDEVWKVLNDPQILKKLMPGCKSLTEVDTDIFEAELSLGIAAVRGDYEGELQIIEKLPPDKYRMKIKGSGKPGFLEADVVVELDYQEPQTIIRYDGTASVGGLIASVGQRVLSGISKMIIKDFFKNMGKEVEGQKV